MTVAVAPAPSMFAVFRRRDFTLLWISQLVSTAGSSLTSLAAGIYVWRATESTLAVGLTLMVTAIPSLVVGLLAGVYVDRHDRRKIMIVTNLIQAVFVGLIAVVIGIDAIALPGLYLLLLADAGVKQFFDPAHDSLIPEVASDEELAAANSFLSIASFGSTAVGFAGAGLLAGTVGLQWAFILDSASFLFSAGCIALMGRYPMPKPDEDASVRVIAANLKAGMVTLIGTPVIRSIFIVAALDVLLVRPVERAPAAVLAQGPRRDRVPVRDPGRPDLGRLRRRLVLHGAVLETPPGAGLDDPGHGGHGPVRRPLWHLEPGRRRDPDRDDLRLLQRAVRDRAIDPAPAEHAARDARSGLLGVLRPARRRLPVRDGGGGPRGRVRHPAPGRHLRRCCCSGRLAWSWSLPGLNVATWGAAAARLRGATAEGDVALRPVRSATLADFDRLTGRLTAFSRLSPEQRASFLRDATVREVPAGTRIVEHGDTASSAYFILDGATTAGVPVDDGFRGLSTMTAGDFFGEIAALTGSLRTADVVADVDTTLLEVPAEALRATMAVPEIQHVMFATMASRLQRTESADLPRLAGIDQADLRDLRTPRPQVEVLPRTYDGHEAGGAVG